ncbi:MAG: lamin tail domain-containing protein [Deltaproteobacteria bacterium]|nr:lamin tail domain-containing protein [Deltaproteobacteria bacterium]
MSTARSRPLFATTLAVVVIATVGCGADGGVQTTGALGERCNKDGSCQRGLVCVNDFCLSSYGYGDPPPGDPTGGDPRPGDPRPSDPRRSDAGPGDPITPPADAISGLTCLDAGVPRARKVPSPGDLVITEVYPDPVGADTSSYREWIEIYVARGPVDLNDLKIMITTTGSPTTKQLASADCLSAATGAYVVVGGQSTATDGVGAGLPINNFTLPNSSTVQRAALALQAGPVTIDQMSYPLPATEGTSYMLKAGIVDAALNDDPQSWCLAGVPNPPFSGIGSPGLANDVCAPACREAATWRAVRTPAAGGLVVTEIYPDPNPPTTDGNREWVELYVATGPVDLNGLSIVVVTSSTSTDTISAADCIAAAPGTYAVVAGQGAATDNVAAAAVITGFALPNSWTGHTAAPLSINLGSTVVDAVSYPLPTTAAVPPSTSSLVGRSYQLAPDQQDAAANDVASAWCAAPGVAGTAPAFVGIGTPGAVNPACP